MKQLTILSSITSPFRGKKKDKKTIKHEHSRSGTLAENIASLLSFEKIVQDNDFSGLDRDHGKLNTNLSYLLDGCSKLVLH